MDKKFESNINQILEKLLDVTFLSFKEDICTERENYIGKHIKRGGDYRKEEEVKYVFPEYISCTFVKNNKKFGINIPTKNIITERNYQYEKNDVVDCGDGLIRMETSFWGKEQPMMLPYIFMGNEYVLDVRKVAEFLNNSLPKLSSILVDN